MAAQKKNQNAPKIAILRLKMENFSGEGTVFPRGRGLCPLSRLLPQWGGGHPSRGEGDTPPHTPPPQRLDCRAYSAPTSAPLAPRLLDHWVRPRFWKSRYGPGSGLGWAKGSMSSIVFTRWRQCTHIGGYIGATWRIRLNHLSAATMWSYVKLL